MKVLVTGGAGFIGSNLVDGLLADGYEVVVVDNLSSGKMENVNAKAKFYQMDICEAGLEKVFAEQQIDFVEHLAAQIDVRHSVEDPAADARTNILGLLNVLENCHRHVVKGVVFSSSGGVVYGEPKRLPALESFPKGPLSPHGVSKLASEFYLCYYAQVMGLPYIALRYANVYGPRQDPFGEAGVVAIFTQKLLRGEVPTIFGDGTQVRDYVFVQDVVRANLLAIKHLAKKGGACKAKGSGCAINDFAYNIGTGNATSVNQLFTILQDIIGFPGEPLYGPARPGELQRSYLNADRALATLGWEPRVDITFGLTATAKYLAEHRK